MTSNEKSPLSHLDAIKLLDLLINDEGFRLQFEQDPATALLEVSAEAAEAGKLCKVPGRLASAEKLASTKLLIASELTERGLFYQPYMFAAEPKSPQI